MWAEINSDGWLTIRGFYFWTYRGYRKIPKIIPGAYIFQRPFLRGLFLEGLIYGAGNLRLKIDWASLIVGSKFTVFALFNFTLYLRGIFQLQALGGLYFEGLIFGILRYIISPVAKWSQLVILNWTMIQIQTTSLYCRIFSEWTLPTLGRLSCDHISIFS